MLQILDCCKAQLVVTNSIYLLFANIDPVAKVLVVLLKELVHCFHSFSFYKVIEICVKNF